jgi:hypothetical protein
MSLAISSAVLEVGYFVPHGDARLFCTEPEEQIVAKEAEYGAKREAGPATVKRRSEAQGGSSDAIN